MPLASIVLLVWEKSKVAVPPPSVPPIHQPAKVSGAATGAS